MRKRAKSIMKIPKYIDKALRLRTKYAILLSNQEHVVDKWLDKHGIDCEYEDTHGGVEIYVNPQDSEERIRQAIAEH